MSTLAKAIERFRRLEKARVFPQRCDHCAKTFVRDDRVSVVESKGRYRFVYVVHETPCRAKVVSA